ncbi:RCC1-like chromosome condensation regulator protein [Chloropicon primus]|uniref:RCC1-like chromosome condensation regulator protein n=1 Tax=Chloropicon primus TaxID=1764295 RepID=A0A5B8MSR1_9CHLO|nr:RCC1-like chromosome condensation regulator protein [Chloropicon primus]UPR01630.1 RCC1-like chromosome condensation regulator protein [Chloropicon primus]|eukprot:QDZ22412.1 RCC1-like chromosome condensation regulator protein [Chloropicon primus]
MEGRGSRKEEMESPASSRSFSSFSSSSLSRTILKLPKNISKSLKVTFEQIAHKKESKVRRKASVNLFQALTAMKKGLQVWKLPHRHKLVGKAHMCFLRLSSDEKFLYWYSHKNKSEVTVYVDQIVEVVADLPSDLSSWKGYSESLAFTVYFQVGISPGRRDSPTASSRDPGSGGVGNVTFVCKNEMEHRIFTSVLRILHEVANHSGASLLSSAREQKTPSATAGGGGHHRAKSLLPPDVMTSEIGSILKGLGARAGESKSAIESSLTPAGLKFSASDLTRKLTFDEAEMLESSSVLDDAAPSVSDVSNLDSRAVEVSESTASFQDGGRVIADLWVWGRDMDKVGNCVSDQMFPALLHGQKTLDAFQIACGEHHVVIIDEFGSVYTWGFSGAGQLGHGAPVESYGPMQVKAFEGSVVTQVSCGTTTTAAITEKGEAFFWGQPMYSLSKPTWYPKLLDTGKHRVKQISCGAYHFAMCTLDGKVLTCGGGKFGALGHGSLDNCLKPKVVEALEIYSVEQVSCGVWHTCVVLRRKGERKQGSKKYFGEVYGWGDNSVGQLGYKEPRMITLPLWIRGLKDIDVRAVECGRHHTLAVTEGGLLYSWGSNRSGQLGRKLGADESGHEPGLVDLKGHVVTEISAGMDHNLVIALKGNQSLLYSWGCGDHGCLGLGDSRSVSLPTQVQRLARKTVVSVACGANTSCAMVEHHFQKEMERADKCKQCGRKLSSGIRNQKKSCARCRVVFCKQCVKQYGLLKPLLPYNALPNVSPVRQPKCPNVCLECRDILMEAQLTTKYHSQDMQQRRLKQARAPLAPKYVSVAPERTIADLEKELRAAHEEILVLKGRLRQQGRPEESNSRE